MNNPIGIAVPPMRWGWGDAILKSNVLFLKLGGELCDAYFILSCTDT